ncbi:MAG TPA: YncE family protein [Casimicrobiaceae bacterium]|nr:YncE family protein [Casimicrobiaceae bacterium]
MNNTIRSLVALSVAALLAACAMIAPTPAGKPEYMLVGIDNKVVFGDDGNLQLLAPGTDSVAIVDIGTDPANPRVVTSLPLMNSVLGPPTNLAVTPDGTLAIVANSVDWVQDGANWKFVPDNKLYVIDLTSSPPARIDTVVVGKQPSGLSINRAGNLALIANRADNSISVLSIQGKQVKLIDTVAMGEMVAAVVFTPDGKRAFAAKFPGHKVALLDVDGQKVTYGKRDLPVGLWPYNLGVTPDGKLALTADNGNSGRSDGNIDTVSVIDLEANPPRAIDRVIVGDGPEGLALSPTGQIAAAMLLRGSDGAKNAWFYNRNGSVAVLRIDGKKVSKIGEVIVGGVPEGAVFSPDGKWLYVGNYADRNISVLRVDGDSVTNTGKVVPLSGSPASMRGRVQ